MHVHTHTYTHIHTHTHTLLIAYGCPSLPMMTIISSYSHLGSVFHGPAGCWMKAPLVLCCAFFFSLPYPLRLKVVDALRHCVSPSDMVCSKGLQFTGWNGADLERLFEHIFPSFLRSPRAVASLLEFPMEDHTGKSVGIHTINMASPVDVW